MHLLDKIDLKILKVLQKKGKITNVQLAKKVGLSPGPTLERVRKLERDGFITGYGAQVNPLKFGLSVQALIQISLKEHNDNALKSFTEKIANVDEILECNLITGNYDYQLKALVEDITALEKLVSEKLSRITEIAQMQTMIVLSQVKKESVLPIQY